MNESQHICLMKTRFNPLIARLLGNFEQVLQANIRITTRQEK
jgi:hypothetical protein